MKATDFDDAIVARARKIKMLVMDVDGVLTDGKIHMGESGELFKSFSIKDGLGIKSIQTSGIQTAIITGRQSNALKLRTKELGIQHLIQKRDDKRQALIELLESTQLSPENIAYIGDDLPDLGAILYAGLGACVADAHEALLTRADWVSSKCGGCGAVRELCDFLLKAQDRYKNHIDSFLS